MDLSSVIVKALATDAKKLSSNPERYIEANEFQYTLAIQTWLDLINQVSGETAAVAVTIEVMGFGLVATIASAVATSKLIIDEDYEQTPSASWALVCQGLDRRDALQVLRYLKRFTPYQCDLLDKDTLSSFKQTLNRNKLRERLELPRYLVEHCRCSMDKLLCEKSMTPLSEQMPNGYPLIGFTRGYFSSGVCWDAKPNCILEKIGAWKSHCFGDIMYPNIPRPGKSSLFPISTAQVVIVPKDYRKKRTIAEEEAERQYYMQGVRTFMREIMDVDAPNAPCPLNRAEDQQAKCFDSRYATIDLSSASDTITTTIACELLPKTLYKVCNDLRSFWLNMPDGDADAFMSQARVLNTIFQTSGSALCFDCESPIFWCILDAATDFAEVFLGEVLLRPHVFGDDCVCDVRCYDTCVEWLEAFGFIVNHDKSYSSNSLFRESCGVEVYDGVEVSTSYWPRTEISGKKDCLESLISLNNRLLDRGFLTAATRVLSKIMDITGKKFTCTNVLEPYYSTDPRTIGSSVSIPLKPKAYVRGKEPVFEYEGHLIISETLSDKLAYNGAEDNYEMYIYTQYLLHGPMFEGPLEALLGVSTSRRMRSHSMVNPRTTVSVAPLI